MCRNLKTWGVTRRRRILRHFGGRHTECACYFHSVASGNAPNFYLSAFVRYFANLSAAGVTPSPGVCRIGKSPLRY